MTGWIVLGVFLLIILGLIIYVIMLYNGFVALKKQYRSGLEQY